MVFMKIYKKINPDIFKTKFSFFRMVVRGRSPNEKVDTEYPQECYWLDISRVPNLIYQKWQKYWVSLGEFYPHER